MLELTQWWRSMSFSDRPWIVLGKGPTFAAHREHVDRYHTLGLNHVVRELRVDVAHAIDSSVVSDCADVLLSNCRWLLMPRQPHMGFAPSSRKLEDLFDDHPVLRTLSEQGRLVWYNLASGEPVGDSPIITARYFSAEAAIDLLGTLGVRDIVSLGVDGGRGYSPQFAHLEGQTMLANGRTTFNAQFAEIDRIVARHGIRYRPLVEPLRVFCGTDESQRVATRVLEHSIRKHCSRPVNFEPMYDLDLPRPKHPENWPRTGFSFYRFAIPQLCGYQGRALYLDADMLVFGDIAELWNIPFEDASVLCTNQSEVPDAWKHQATHFQPGRQLSVMLIDCARLQWDVRHIVNGLDEGRYNYQQLMFDLCIVDDGLIQERIPPVWNCLEWHDPGRTKLLHYTVTPSQPWKNDENPLRHLWEGAFRDAVRDGAVSGTEVEHGITNGHLKPSLRSALAVARKPESGSDRPYQPWTKPQPSPERSPWDRIATILTNPRSAFRALARRLAP